jgi:hypothetical protein
MKLFLKRSVEMFVHCASCVLSLTVYSCITCLCIDYNYIKFTIFQARFLLG